MGLDMYLKAERYVWGDERKEVKNTLEVFNLVGKAEVDSITFEIGYWRKANQIHNWFVQNCQGGVDECQNTRVSREKLAELLELCQKVKNDPSLGPTLLPTVSGFFFGGTDYDEYYLKDIDHTITVLTNALSLDESYDFYYRSSW